jgi:DNA polymerase-4
VTPTWILHVDLDQFIAAVEIRRDPSLRGRPVVVGGDGDPTRRRQVVATASYEARAFGVHSGMPLTTAHRKCPDAVFLPSDRDAYDAASGEVWNVVRELPVVTEVWGWDEAFLGTDTADPEALAQEIRQTVVERTGFTCCVGIGDNKVRAKMATGFAKARDGALPEDAPGVFRLTKQNWLEVMGDRKTDALWGVGAKTSAKLSELGITLCMRPAPSFVASSSQEGLLALAHRGLRAPALRVVVTHACDRGIWEVLLRPNGKGREPIFPNQNEISPNVQAPDGAVSGTS